MSFTSNLSFVRKSPVTTSVATIALLVGAVFTIKAAVTGRPPSGVIIHQYQTGSGVRVGYVTDSGSLAMSGNTLLSDQKTGSGIVKVGGTDGAVVCLADGDGTGCTCTEANNGVLQTYVGVAAQCP